MPDFKVTHYQIRTGKTQRGPDTPFTTVFLSDLHNSSYGNQNSRLLQEIRNADPEIVFISGDMINAGKEVQTDAAISLMDRLTQLYPVYYANGNHETRLKGRGNEQEETYETYTEAIRSCGVHLLENAPEQIEIHRMPMNIWGLELPMEYYMLFHRENLTKEHLDELLGVPLDNTFQLLLAHNPLYFDAYADWGADLTLSGHLHGGLIRLPLLGGLIAPQFRLFPKYDRGLFDQNGRKMIVSAGLGDHSVQLRVNNPPELIVLDFI